MWPSFTLHVATLSSRTLVKSESFLFYSIQYCCLQTGSKVSGSVLPTILKKTCFGIEKRGEKLDVLINIDPNYYIEVIVFSLF